MTAAFHDSLTNVKVGMTPSIQMLFNEWGVPAHEYSPQLLEFAGTLTAKPVSRVGDMVVSFGLATREEVEHHAANKPANVLMLEYLADRIDNLRPVTQKLLAANERLAYYEAIPVASVHLAHHNNPAFHRFCSSLNCLLLISNQPNSVRLLFTDYSTLKEYSQRARLQRSNDPIGQMLQAESLTLIYAIAQRDQLNARLYSDHGDAANTADQEDQLNVWTDTDANTDNQRILVRILSIAVQKKASNIKFTPLQNGTVQVQYRLHGNLRPIPNIRPLSPQQADELNRFLHTKSVARYTSTSKRVEGLLLHMADGQFVFRTSVSETFLRCGFIPVANDSLTNPLESISIRLLDRDAVTIRLQSLNISPEIVEELRFHLTQKHGLILIVGPTSSGKSTTIAGAITLYRDIYGSTRNLMSLEQPVERHLEGITQIQVNQSQFEAGMAALLRHDPNFIWVGEIRDRPSASTCVRASNTGQIVVSTLHSDDSTLAVNALLAYISNTTSHSAESVMVTAYDAINALSLIIAQRLVPILCDYCQIPIATNPAIHAEHHHRYRQYCSRNEIPHDPQAIEGTYLRNPDGCPHCDFEGYKGERPINEMLPMTRALRRQMTNNTNAGHSDNELLAKHRSSTLHQDAMRYVRTGIVSIEDALI